MKTFNITGQCIPRKHYMVCIDDKLTEIKKMVDKGNYFVINRARQYGKTTTLRILAKHLKEDYVVISLDFQKMSAAQFKDECTFAISFSERLLKVIRNRRNIVAGLSEESLSALQEALGTKHLINLGQLFDYLSELCDTADKPIVLMIDEVDSATNNQVFLDFLAQLRAYYIDREDVSTFHSVILAGVYDIKNLKRKIRSDEEHKYNSPKLSQRLYFWNIAETFDVDMSFSMPEIATMLADYEADYHTGMEIMTVAEHLHYYTNGYPFLVSSLCKTIHDKCLSWTANGVDEAEKHVLKSNNTLFDDIVKNLVNNTSLSKLVESVLLHGEQVSFEIRNPDISLGVMLGILVEKDGQVSISNILFETQILNYYISIAQIRGVVGRYVSDTKQRYVSNGRLDMSEVLERFAAFIHAEYRDEDGLFIERQGRLLFLSFLKPIINGTGHYAVEPETRGSRRMDVVVFYSGEEHIVELKIWHGEQAAEDAYEQLTGYLESRGQKQGYLLSFCNNKKSPREGKKFEYKGCVIYEVIVAYRDKE